jgi:hypothetical protein
MSILEIETIRGYTVCFVIDSKMDLGEIAKSYLRKYDLKTWALVRMSKKRWIKHLGR